MRIVLITIAVIGLCVAWNCASDPPLPSETDTLKRITDGVWFRVLSCCSSNVDSLMRPYWAKNG